MLTEQTHLIYVKQNFLAQKFRVDFPVLRTPGSHFKTPITLWKIAKNQNGTRKSLMGQGGAD